MKRWPIIRHIRYYVALYKFNRWWMKMSIYFITPNPYDLEYLEGIKSGKH